MVLSVVSSWLFSSPTSAMSRDWLAEIFCSLARMALESGPGLDSMSQDNNILPLCCSGRMKMHSAPMTSEKCHTKSSFGRWWEEWANVRVVITQPVYSFDINSLVRTHWLRAATRETEPRMASAFALTTGKGDITAYAPEVGKGIPPYKHIAVWEWASTTSAEQDTDIACERGRRSMWARAAHCSRPGRNFYGTHTKSFKLFAAAHIEPPRKAETVR